jgi:hypothetical protein
MPPFRFPPSPTFSDSSVERRRMAVYGKEAKA